MCYHADMSDWDFLTNHARVLLAIAKDPGMRLRDIAATVGISQRRVFGIVTDLTQSGYLVKEKKGRRNTYEIRTARPLDEELTDRPAIGDVLRLLTAASQETLKPDPSNPDR